MAGCGGCRRGEMADARDLKSLFARAECGFESRRRQALSGVVGLLDRSGEGE